jgi:hypothetical protein
MEWPSVPSGQGVRAVGAEAGGGSLTIWDVASVLGRSCPRRVVEAHRRVGRPVPWRLRLGGDTGRGCLGL